MLTVVIVEEKLLLRTGLEAVLSEVLPYATFFPYHTSDDFMNAAQPSDPGIIIYGVSKRMSGRAALQHLSIKKYFHECRVVFLEEGPEVKNVVDYFRHGLDGYLLNTTGENELRECMQSLVLRKPYLSTELTVACYLSEGAKTSEVARKLERNPSSISTMKRRIFMKLKVDSLFELREALRTLAL